MKKHLILILMLFSIAGSFFSSCKDENSATGGEAYNPSKPVTVTTFYPDSGKIAEKVMLDGANFGNDPSKIKVYFNKKRAAVIGSTGNRMYVICPKMPGDTCTVSVVVGNDSVIYAQQFRYKISVSVSTIAGNGTSTFKAGTLAEATLNPVYLCVDKEDNIFVTLRDNSSYGVVRINELENIVTALCWGSSYNDWSPQPPCVDPTTGVVTSGHDNIVGAYYSFDPKEAWMPRIRTMQWKAGTNVPANVWKKSMAACAIDGCFYLHYYNGNIVKVNPKTYEAETIFITPASDGNGLAFHPQHPNMLYISFTNSGDLNNGIYSLDINDPAGTFQRLNGSTAAGHRDGELRNAQFNKPFQIFFDPDGNLYVADSGNHCIRKIDTSTNMVETVLGHPGTSGWKDGGKEDALFKDPRGIGVSKDGNVYVADYGNFRVRKLAIE
ncbi:MAG: hypothetical protein EZS26_000836 [Candidatus Ordinivivax streblomastigis]|uniref:IPT/TIG domain-containing protein n=1 Tax=Candidatus Ordinivivax streblomastigis TaxID=2540710 RepID=A0A5M8P3F7_9BACT|nr:MAG: hypothetical protein EZS26_000836 [Candidatus Ordinivivax streblomastigis]